MTMTMTTPADTTAGNASGTAASTDPELVVTDPAPPAPAPGRPLHDLATPAPSMRTAPRTFDAPQLDGDNTLRVVARHDATAQRRRLDAGFQAGYAHGHAAGAAAVDAAIAEHRRHAERLASLCDALQAARVALHAEDAAETEAIEAGVVALAMDVAESVVNREITDHELVVDTIRRALAVAPRHDDTRILVHPDDLECAREAHDAGLTGTAGPGELVADATVGRGGCVVEAGGARLDAQVDEALERVRTALSTV